MIKDIIPAILTGTAPTIFEIGANDGLDTIWLSQIAKVLHAFEPDDRAFSKLSRIKFKNKVVLNKCAIGRESDNATFYQSSGTWPFAPLPGTSGDWDKSGSLKKPKLHITTHPWCKFNTQVIVRVETLDDYCIQNQIDRIDFIWADVQGAEADVIAGGRETFPRRVKYFFTEYANTELYDGQPVSVGQIKALLPQFKMIQDFGGDALFMNESL